MSVNRKNYPPFTSLGSSSRSSAEPAPLPRLYAEGRGREKAVNHQAAQGFKTAANLHEAIQRFEAARQLAPQNRVAAEYLRRVTAASESAGDDFAEIGKQGDSYQFERKR